MPAASIDRQLRGTFVIDEDRLRRLCDTVRAALGKVLPGQIALLFTIRFSDQFALEVRSLEEVLKEENPGDRAIVGLDIYGEAGDSSVLIRFNPHLEGGSRFDVDGTNRSWVYDTAREIEERLHRMKQWRPPDGALAVTGLILVFAVPLVVGWFISQHDVPVLGGATGDGKFRLTFLGLLFFLGLGFGTGFVFFKLNRWLLPPLFVRIGDGIARHDLVRKVRWGIFSFIVVGGMLGEVFGSFVRRVFLLE